MSLTPAHRSQEASSEAMQEGLIAGGLVLAPAVGGVYLAIQKSATFAARTNWQSRTAIAIMPALFAFAWTSERHLEQKMNAIAEESQHHRNTVKWAEQERKRNLDSLDKEVHLMDLYRNSVEESGVNVVPGDKLGFHHRLANYVSANPIKCLAGMAAPSIALIFYGNSGKEHLQFSTKLLHTRVFGQFTTLSIMLSIMGFKDYMDRNGVFITEVEADRRVQEMAAIRQALADRLDYEEHLIEVRDHEIALAHEHVLQQKAAAKKQRKNSNNNTVAPAAAMATSPSN